MGKAMVSKSLIQISVDGQDCVPSLLFDLKPSYDGGNEDNGNLLQMIPCRHCYTQCPQPCSRPWPAQTSTRDSWRLLGKSGSVSCGGHCSFIVGPGAHKVLFVPSKSLFPQFYVSSSGSMVGLMATSSKRADAIPRSAAPRTLPLRQVTADPYLHRRQTLKGRSGSVSCGVPGSWCE